MVKVGITTMMAFLLLAIGLVPTGANAFELITTTETVVVNDIEIEIVKTADNFIVLFDSSGSMDDTYKDTGKKKIDLAKAIMKTRNADLPDLKFNAGLYTYAPQSISLSSKTLKPYYEMQPYDKAKFAEAIDQLPTEAKGPTLLQQGLSELDPILAGLKGHTVVFVMTDASYTDRGSDATGQEVLEEDMSRPVNIAKALTEKYNVSFFVINSSSTKKEPQLVKAIESIGESTRVITFETLLNNPHVFSGALFVLNPKIVQKSVDIEKIIGVELKSLLFGFDQAEIAPKYAEGLKLLGEYLQGAPGTRLTLSGYSDSTGPQEYNHLLSHRRVVNVANYLIENFNISPDRISMSWYGAANPIASNATSEGRALNRRVEGFIY